MIHRTARATALCLAAALLASGCASTGGAAFDTAAGRPVSGQPASSAGEARARNNVELGTAYLEIGRYDVALDEARSALGHYANYAPAFNLMGLVYMMLENNAAADDNFRRALSIAPNDPDFNNAYGWFQCVSGRTSEGLERLNAAAGNPYNRFPGRALTNAGLCNLRTNDDAGASAYFSRALMVEPNNAQANYHMAAIAYRTQDYPGARQHLANLHRANEPTAASLWLALRVERRLGNVTSESAYASQLRSRFVNSPEYQQMLRGQYE